VRVNQDVSAGGEARVLIFFIPVRIGSLDFADAEVAAITPGRAKDDFGIH